MVWTRGLEREGSPLSASYIRWPLPVSVPGFEHGLLSLSLGILCSPLDSLPLTPVSNVYCLTSSPTLGLIASSPARPSIAATLTDTPHHHTKTHRTLSPLPGPDTTRPTSISPHDPARRTKKHRTRLRALGIPHQPCIPSAQPAPVSALLHARYGLHRTGFRWALAISSSPSHLQPPCRTHRGGHLHPRRARQAQNAGRRGTQSANRHIAGFIFKARGG